MAQFDFKYKNDKDRSLIQKLFSFFKQQFSLILFVLVLYILVVHVVFPANKFIAFCFEIMLSLKPLHLLIFQFIPLFPYYCQLFFQNFLPRR